MGRGVESAVAPVAGLDDDLVKEMKRDWPSTRSAFDGVRVCEHWGLTASAREVWTILERLAKENMDRVALDLSGVKRGSAPHRSGAALRALRSIFATFLRRAKVVGRRHGVWI